MSDIKAKSLQYFMDYPKEDEFLVTSDGQFFLPKDKSAAFTQEKSLGKKGKDKPATIKRSDVKSELDKFIKEAEAENAAKQKAKEARQEEESQKEGQQSQEEIDKKIAQEVENPVSEKLAEMKVDKDDPQPEETESTGSPEPPADEKPETPEGNPTEKWTIPEIKAWLDEREVKYVANAKEANLLGKVAEYLKAQEKE